MAPAMLKARPWQQERVNECRQSALKFVQVFVAIPWKRFASHRPISAFTLVEVLVAVAIVGLVFTGIISAYVTSTDRSEWSGYSLAAQSLAVQGMEQVRSAKWDPLAWPAVDELGSTNLVQIEALDVTASKQTIFATNYISVKTLPGPIPIREIRCDCVWSLEYRKPGNRGPFTNTAVTLRAPDQ